MSVGAKAPSMVASSAATATTAAMQTQTFLFTDLLTRAVPVMRTTKNPHLAIQLEDGLMRLIAGDHIALLTMSTELVTIKTPGKFSVRGKKLHGIARHAGGAEIAMCVVGGSMATLESGAQRWTLPASASLWVPSMSPTPQAYTEVQVEALAAAVSRVRAAGTISKLEGEPKVQIGGDGLQVTSGRLFHREEVAGLAQYGCSITWARFCLLDAVIGSGAFGSQGTANVACDETGLHIWNPGSHLRLRASENDLALPPFVAEALTNDAVLHVDRVELRDAVRSVTVHLASETPAVRLSAAANKLVVTAKDWDGHTGRDELNAGWPHGETTAQFHSTAMLRMLAAHKSPGCEFRLATDAKQDAPSWHLVGTGRFSVLRQWT